MMTTNDPLAEPPPPTVITITTTEWKKLYDLVDDAIAKFIVRADEEAIPTDVPYITEWISIYDRIKDAIADNPDTTYQVASADLFGEPATLLDFAYEIMRIVPTVRPMFKVKRAKKRGDVIATILHVTDEVYTKMKNIHYKYIPTDRLPEPELSTEKDDEAQRQRAMEELFGADESDPDKGEVDNSYSLSSSIQEQVKDIEAKLDIATKALQEEITDNTSSLKRDIGGLKDTINETLSDTIALKVDQVISEGLADTVKTAITEAMKMNMEANESLKDSIIQGQRLADKLTGDIKNAKETLDTLTEKANTIKNTAMDATNNAAKAYLKAKQDMELTKELVQQDTKAILMQVKDLAEETSHIKRSDSDEDDTFKPRYKHKYYADEYNIKGKTIQVRSKKFQEDTTPIDCDSKDTLLIMYELLEHVAKQYGIFITPVKDLDVWDPEDSMFPTTFPYNSDDFDDEESFLNAHNSMSLALANKLKTGINVNKNFIAATMAIDKFEMDGYVMLYDLIKVVHPKLLRNKAVRPKKPNFKGDIKKYITEYKNWIKYQLNRERPHHYDDDEIADDIIFALKSSEWNPALAKGIDILETKMDRWRANESESFPRDLKLQFISQTIMSYYVENNIDPFQRNERHGTRPTIRTFKQRGRSRTPSYRKRSQSPSPYARRRSFSNQSQSSKQSQYEECDICGGMHKPSTKGCPHLYRQVKVNEYLARTNKYDVEKQVNDIERHRSQSRSQSRDSRQSSRSHSNQRN